MNPEGSQRADITTLVFCALAALLEGFDTQSMGVAGPLVTAEFGLSRGQAGLIFSATPLGLFVGAAIGGRVADFLGRKQALSASLLLFGVFSLLTAAASGPDSLIAARLLTGLGLGGAMPNFIALASESTSGRRRLSVVTVIMAAMPFGGSIAALVALYAGAGALSWRSIFYVGGFAPLLLAGGMLMWLRDPTGVGAGSHERVASMSAALFNEERAGATWMLWTGYFFTQLVLLLMLNWLPSLIVALGYDRKQASLAAVAFNLGGSLGSFFLGRLHAGDHRRRWVVVTYSGMVAALAAVASGSYFAIVAGACAVAGVFIVGAQLVLFALAPLYYPASIRGTGVGAAVATGRLGSVVGPLYASALLASGGSSGGVLFGIVPFVLVGGAAAFALTYRRQCGD